MNTKRLLTNKYGIILVALFCCLLWGSAFPVLKISYSQMKMAPNDLFGKIVFAGMRFFLASMLLFLVTKFNMGISLKMSRFQLLKLLQLGVLQTFLQYFFFYNGLAHTTGIKSAILSSIGSFFVVILSHYAYTNDKINGRKIIGLSTGFAGIILINLNSSSFSLSVSFVGEGFMVISGFVSAFGTILAKNLSEDIHPFLLTAWQMLLGSVLLILTGIWKIHSNSLIFTPKSFLLLVYLSFLSAAAFSLWYSLLRYNKAGEITLYKFFVPVSGAILSAWILPSEKFSIDLLGGLILVALGIVSINYHKAK